MRIFKNKKNCLNCIFFCKTYPEGNRPCFSIKEKVREEIQKTNKVMMESYYSYSCRQGIWDCGVGLNTKKNIFDIVTKKRKKETCFFFKYSDGMLFNTALELVKRESNKTFEKKTRHISYIGIVISIIGLCISYFKS